MEFSLLARIKIWSSFPDGGQHNRYLKKPASATMGCGLEIEKAFSRSGVPEGVFQTVVLDGASGEVLIDSEDVNAVTFTGSVLQEARLLKEQHHK